MEKADAELLVLPALSNTGYHCVSRQEAEALAEEIPLGKTTETLCRRRREKGLISLPV